MKLGPSHVHRLRGPNLCFPDMKVYGISTVLLPWWEIVAKKKKPKKYNLEKLSQLYCWLSLLYVNLSLHSYCIVIEWLQLLKTLKIKPILSFNICGLCVHSWLTVSRQAAALNYSLSELALKEFFFPPYLSQVTTNEKATSSAAAALENFHQNPHSMSLLKITVPRICCYLLEGHD